MTTEIQDSCKRENKSKWIYEQILKTINEQIVAQGNIKPVSVLTDIFYFLNYLECDTVKFNQLLKHHC